jgi:hypothetical protein
MRSSIAVLFAASLALSAQEAALDPHSSIKLDVPADSPVSLISANMGESRASARGGAMLLDLHVALKLRNAGQRTIRGVTLLVLAQEATPGGKASVSVPSLDVRPGDIFPVRVDVRLLRPLQQTGAPLVQVAIDGVLFSDLSFYGPNRLNSRRAMVAWESEAQRDRQYFKGLLASQGPEALQRAMLESLSRQADRPRLDIQVSRRNRAVVSSAGISERIAQFAFVQIPGSPVRPLQGWAEISGSEARSPRIEVVNRSAKSVSYVEIGWIVRDREGREFMAASVPASDSNLYLPPGHTGRILQDTALRFSRNAGEPVPIQGMTGFVSQVEYSDGEVWVPNRASLDNPQLQRVLAPSPEEQRLTELYRKKGLAAVAEELKKF